MAAALEFSNLDQNDSDDVLPIRKFARLSGSVRISFAVPPSLSSRFFWQHLRSRSSFRNVMPVLIRPHANRLHE